MDIIEINKYTQNKKVMESRNNLSQKKMQKEDSLRLILYACKKMYGLQATVKLIHGIGVDKIDLHN